MRYFPAKLKRNLGIYVLSFLVIASVAGCAGGGSGTTTGTLSLYLTDATTEEYNAVYVTIREVQVSPDETTGDTAWQVVASPNTTYNLLELVNGVMEQLGLTDLQPGHYAQMRLIIGTDPDSGTNILGETHPYANYVIDESDEYHELKIPSGLQTGIKLVAGFDIYGGQVTELILDFDVLKSVVKAGASGKWLLKPTIKVLGTTIATITGTVTDASNGGAVLAGAAVSAQIYYSEDTYPDTDAKDRVVVQASTVTDENGRYTLFVQPGIYNLVGYKEGYSPQFTKIIADSNTAYTQNFAMTATSTGTISGHVIIGGGSDEDFVVLSFRQTVNYGGGAANEEIEIRSDNVVNNGDYSVSLPPETYNVVASTAGKTTQEHAVSVSTGTGTTLDVTF